MSIMVRGREKEKKDKTACYYSYYCLWAVKTVGIVKGTQVAGAHKDCNISDD